MNSSEGFWNDFFSHVYVEERALDYPVTREILDNLSDKKIIRVNHYKDVFSPKQDFAMQKNSQKLIPAVRSGNFFYRGSPMCHDYGYDDFFYAPSVMNCPFDCDYCYLRGLYPSANIVAFVNLSDTFDEINKSFREKKPFICVSYDSDLLALEKIFSFARRWIYFAKQNKNITFELRTKSANFSAIADIEPAGNLILAWTLSPQEYISEFEKKTPGLDARIKNINAAAESGWKVRICLDPLLYLTDCVETYNSFFKVLYDKIDLNKILDVSAGVFRVPRGVMKKMSGRARNPVLVYPFVEKRGIMTYRDEHINELYGLLDGFKRNLPVYKMF